MRKSFSGRPAPTFFIGYSSLAQNCVTTSLLCCFEDHEVYLNYHRSNSAKIRLNWRGKLFCGLPTHLAVAQYCLINYQRGNESAISLFQPWSFAKASCDSEDDVKWIVCYAYHHQRLVVRPTFGFFSCSFHAIDNILEFVLSPSWAAAAMCAVGPHCQAAAYLCKEIRLVVSTNTAINAEQTTPPRASACKLMILK